MWSDWLVSCDCGFQSVFPLMEKDKRLMEASWWDVCVCVYTYSVREHLISFFTCRKFHFLPSTTYWRDCPLSIIHSCLLCLSVCLYTQMPLCVWSGDHRRMSLPLGFLSCAEMEPYFCFCASTILSWWLLLCSIVWSQRESLIPPSPFFFLMIVLAIWCLLCFQIFGQNFCSISVKNSIGCLLGIALNL